MYKIFAVGDVVSKYKLTIGDYSGNAGKTEGLTNLPNLNLHSSYLPCLPKCRIVIKGKDDQKAISSGALCRIVC